MLRELEVSYAGLLYTVQLDPGQTASGDPPARAGRGTWHVTVGPTAVTSFEATPGETEAAVRERVISWLEAHPEFRDRDRVHLGGG